MNKLAYGYMRVGALDRTLESQAHVIAACAAANGYTLSQTFCDKGIVGNGVHPLGLAALLSEIANDDARAVVVNDLSRFSRDPGELSEIVKMLKSRNVAIYLAAERGAAF